MFSNPSARRAPRRDEERSRGERLAPFRALERLRLRVVTMPCVSIRSMDQWASPWPVIAGTMTVLVGAATIWLIMYRGTSSAESVVSPAEERTTPESVARVESRSNELKWLNNDTQESELHRADGDESPARDAVPQRDGVRISGDYAEAVQQPRMVLSAEEESVRSSMVRRLEMCMGQLPRDVRQEMCAAIVRDVHWQQQHGAGRLAEPPSRAFLRGQESSRRPQPGAQGMAAMLPSLPDPRVQAAKAGRGRDFRSSKVILAELLQRSLRDAGVSQLSGTADVDRSSLEQLVSREGLVAPFRAELREALTRKFAKHPDRVAHPARYPCLRETVDPGAPVGPREGESKAGATSSRADVGTPLAARMPGMAMGEEELELEEEELDARVEALLANVAAAAETLD